MIAVRNRTNAGQAGRMRAQHRLDEMYHLRSMLLSCTVAAGRYTSKITLLRGVRHRGSALRFGALRFGAMCRVGMSGLGLSYRHPVQIRTSQNRTGRLAKKETTISCSLQPSKQDLREAASPRCWWRSITLLACFLPSSQLPTL